MVFSIRSNKFQTAHFNRLHRLLLARMIFRGEIDGMIKRLVNHFLIILIHKFFCYSQMNTKLFMNHFLLNLIDKIVCLSQISDNTFLYQRIFWGTQRTPHRIDAPSFSNWQAVHNLEIAQSIHALYEEMKFIFTQTLSSKHSLAVLDFVFTYPVFRNSRLSELSNIPPATANRFTKALLEKGILTLKEEASGRKSALYSFERMMELVRV